MDRSPPTERAEVDRVAPEVRPSRRATERRATGTATVMNPRLQRLTRGRNQNVTERIGSKWIGWKPAGSLWSRRKKRSSISWVWPRTTRNSSCSASPRPGSLDECEAKLESRLGFVRSLPHPNADVDSVQSAVVMTVTVLPMEIVGVGRTPVATGATSRTVGKRSRHNSRPAATVVRNPAHEDPQVVRARLGTAAASGASQLVVLTQREMIGR